VSAAPGDPASVSACASVVRSVATALEASGEPLAGSLRELADGWTGRVSATTRRRGEALAAAAGTTAVALDRVAVVLQDHATDLAELRARARRLEDRAAAAGLELRDGRVVPRYGVAGEADAAGDHRRAEVAAAVQEELDAVAARHARRRDWLVGVMRASTEELAAASRALRRG
jgi:uncharacterized protein YukE